jgi:hypothetical protein
MNYGVPSVYDPMDDWRTRALMGYVDVPYGQAYGTGIDWPHFGVPGFRLDPGVAHRAQADLEGWWTAGKIAVALGAVVAVYFAYKTFKEAKPMSKREAEIAGEALVLGLGARRGARSSRRMPEIIEAEEIEYGRPRRFPALPK